eukprot:9637285-Alexandrium_andersonii.AAC.1
MPSIGLSLYLSPVLSHFEAYVLKLHARVMRACAPANTLHATTGAHADKGTRQAQVDAGMHLH